MPRNRARRAVVASPLPDGSNMTGGTSQSDVPVTPVSRTGRVSLLLGVLVALVLVALVAFSLGRLSTLIGPDPTTTSAEAGFARDMQVHHNQGVELAMIVREKSSDAAVRALAYDIERTQAQQAGQLYGWRRCWCCV